MKAYFITADERFGEDLLPARAESRRAALEWLAGNTFADRLDRVQGLSGTLFERTLSALALLAERTAQWPESTRPDLSALFRRLAGHIETPLAVDHGSQLRAPEVAAPITAPCRPPRQV